MCPHTSSMLVVCVLIILASDRDSFLYVSSYYYMVMQELTEIPLSMCPHNTICVLILLHGDAGAD
jgi:hypothetical protein